MAEPYLRKLRAIVDRTCLPADAADAISCRHFFGGAAAFVGERIFMTLTPVGLALKLSENDRAMLFKQGAKPLQYFQGAPIKRDYVLLPAQPADDYGDIGSLILRSIEFVGK